MATGSPGPWAIRRKRSEEIGERGWDGGGGGGKRRATPAKLAATELASRVERVATSAPVDGIETAHDGTLSLTGLETYSIRRLKSDGQFEEWLRDARCWAASSSSFYSG